MALGTGLDVGTGLLCGGGWDLDVFVFAVGNVSGGGLRGLRVGWALTRLVEGNTALGVRVDSEADLVFVEVVH